MLQPGDKVESPWGRHLIPRIDANTVIDLAFMSGRVQRDLANYIRQKVLEGFPAQGSGCRKPNLDSATQDPVAAH